MRRKTRHLLGMLGRRQLLGWAGAAALGWAFPDTALATVSLNGLFVIARSKNKNVVRYRARVHDGYLDSKQPIEADWLMLAEDGRREELSWAERKLAYGFSVSDLSADACALTLVAFQGRSLRVERHGESFKALATIKGQRALLERVFVQTREGGLVPRVDYVELSGQSLAGGAVNERLTPR